MFDKYKNEMQGINFVFADDFKISTILKKYAESNSYEWDKRLCSIIDGNEHDDYELDKIKLD